jgi:hypothetical protein
MKTTKSTDTATITFEIASSEEMILKAKQLCHDVYLQVGYIKEPLPGRMIPFEYEESSTYIVAINSEQEVVGTVRLTQGPPFKTLKIWEGKLFPAAGGVINDAIHKNTFEIGALAVKKDFSPMKISLGLYKAVYFCSILLKLDYGIICMDARALRSLEMLGWFVEKIGEPMDYFGSLTVPGIMPVNKQNESLWKNEVAFHEHRAA